MKNREAAVLVRNADRIMTAAEPRAEGIYLTFADGCQGRIPFTDLPEIRNFSRLKSVELPNPYVLIVSSTDGESIELPWDFARHYCDPDYQPRIEGLAASGRRSLGSRIRQLRKASGLTQHQLSSAAGIGRVTLARIENGEQSPRYETLTALSRALGRPLTDLLLAGPAA